MCYFQLLLNYGGRDYCVCVRVYVVKCCIQDHNRSANLLQVTYNLHLMLCTLINFISSSGLHVVTLRLARFNWQMTHNSWFNHCDRLLLLARLTSECCLAGWRLSSVTLPTGGRHCTAGQSCYVPRATHVYIHYNNGPISMGLTVKFLHWKIIHGQWNV